MTMINKLAVGFLALSSQSAASPTLEHRGVTSFRHPGLLLDSDQIDIVRENALSGNDPWSSTYLNLQSNSYSSSSYTVRGPHPQIGANTGNDTITSWTNDWQRDCIAAYLNALRYVITREDAFAQKVAEIVDGWSSQLTAVLENDNLNAGLPGRQLVNAAELVRYTRGSWPSGASGFTQAQSFVSSVLVPHVYPQARPPSQPTVGGNQAFMGHAVAAQMAIFTNNVTGFNNEITVLLDGPKACSGSLDSGMQAMIHSETGQCAEAGRDQGHSADELGWIEEMSRVAANQGDTRLFDLLAADGETPLLALGFEYYAKYNTGGNVPFDTTWHPCCCGNVDYEVISNISRGQSYVFGEDGYSYYTSKGVSLPHMEQWLQLHRPLEITDNVRDWLAWATLNFARGIL